MSFKNTKGFSIIEMMVAVAIMGMLATIALPKFDRFVAKAKRTEVTVMLSGIHHGLKIYHSDKGSYSLTMSDIGIKLSPKHYDVGFHCGSFKGARASDTTVGADQNFNSCHSWKKHTTYLQAKCSGGSDVDFIYIGAVGNIDNDPATDVFAMDLQRTLVRGSVNDDVIDSVRSNTSSASVCKCMKDNRATRNYSSCGYVVGGN